MHSEQSITLLGGRDNTSFFK